VSEPPAPVVAAPTRLPPPATWSTIVQKIPPVASRNGVTSIRRTEVGSAGQRSRTATTTTIPAITTAQPAAPASPSAAEPLTATRRSPPVSGPTAPHSSVPGPVSCGASDLPVARQTSAPSTPRMHNTPSIGRLGSNGPADPSIRPAMGAATAIQPARIQSSSRIADASWRSRPRRSGGRLVTDGGLVTGGDSTGPVSRAASRRRPTGRWATRSWCEAVVSNRPARP